MGLTASDSPAVNSTRSSLKEVRNEGSRYRTTIGMQPWYLTTNAPSVDS